MNTEVPPVIQESVTVQVAMRASVNCIATWHVIHDVWTLQAYVPCSVEQVTDAIIQHSINNPVLSWSVYERVWYIWSTDLNNLEKTVYTVEVSDDAIPVLDAMLNIVER